MDIFLKWCVWPKPMFAFDSQIIKFSTTNKITCWLIHKRSILWNEKPIKVAAKPHNNIVHFNNVSQPGFLRLCDVSFAMISYALFSYMKLIMILRLSRVILPLLLFSLQGFLVFHCLNLKMYQFQ